MIRSRNKQQGFTLVELLFSVAFIGFILLFIVSTIVQVFQTYNKGLAVKEINQTARSVLDDMSRVARTTPYNVITTGTSGRLCFGSVSYVWNVRNSNTNSYAGGGRVTLARVNDSAKAMCSGNTPVPKNDATVLLSDRIWVHKVTLTPEISGQVATIQVQLSTSDQTNTELDISGAVPTCRAGIAGQFCAVADFTTTVALKVR